MHEKQSELRFKKFSKWISRKKNTWNGKHPSDMAVRLTASLPLKNRLKPPKRNFIFQPVLFTGYVSLRELLVWERVYQITFVENMTQHWGRRKPSPGLGNTAGAGSPKQNTIHMGVSLNGGTPQNTPKWSFLVGKPMVVGYHQFRKPPRSKLNFDHLVHKMPYMPYFYPMNFPIFEWTQTTPVFFPI